ncbi:reverse transcriptase domain-containing protein [Pseudomonas sp. ZT5P21]
MEPIWQRRRGGSISPTSTAGSVRWALPLWRIKSYRRRSVTVLNVIYEEGFLGFSYGFRPGRSQHDALVALTVALKGQKVNWILDADITSIFDEIDHEWMLMFLGHRIADRRLLGLICKLLQAGVVEDGHRVAAIKGTPQGAVISPLLANIFTTCWICGRGSGASDKPVAM